MSAVDVALSPIPEEAMRSSGYMSNQWSPCSSEFIIIYLTVAGSVIPLRVLESDSVASVKLLIQTHKGFEVKRQKLVFGGRELSRNDSSVKDYGIGNGNVLHLVLKLSDLLVITVTTTFGEEFELHVNRHRSVGYLKHRIAEKGRGFVDQELFWNGVKLEDQKLIDEICDNNDAVIHLVVQKSAEIHAESVEGGVELSVVSPYPSELPAGKNRSTELLDLPKKPIDGDFLLEPIIFNSEAKFPASVWDMFNHTFDGLMKGKNPVQSIDGTGGAYFMQEASGNQYVAVFKPIDEEPLAVNSPRHLPLSENGEGLKRGTRVGEGAIREVAAYLLDHPKSGRRSYPNGEIGFAGVPPTVMVQCLHKAFNHPEGYDCSSDNLKVGSLQMFIQNDGSCEDMGPQDFPVEEVHKITVLDIRTANADRHAGNILVTRDEEARIGLVPIDHGYCLPENFEDCTFDWLYWPQARQHYSPEIIDYIRSLDAEQDIALLRFYGWDLPVECARTLRISTMLLKKGVERGLTPFAIGSIMCRPNVKTESAIEEIVNEARDSLLPGMSEATFMETVSKNMDIRLDNLVKLPS